jgi:SAM-dependent methyltransferase
MMPARSAVELTVGRLPPVRLLFVEEQGRTYVVPSEIPSTWYSAASRERSCHVRWPDGRALTAAASIRTDPALLTRLEELFRNKYGSDTWTTYFATRTEALEIDPGGHQIPPQTVDRIRGEFDAVSSGYDVGLDRQPTERYLKDRVTALVLPALRGRDPILEIGPGTGYHTMSLLNAGHRVLAVDISGRMLEQLRAKADRGGFGHLLETRTARLGDIGTALTDVAPGYFGAAFSAFGAFNLDPDVVVAAPALSRLIRPGGPLIFTSLNRPGLTPVLWELAFGRFAAAGNRVGGRVPAYGIRYPLALQLRRPSEWDTVLAEGFTRTDVHPVSVLAPPFDSTRVARFLGDQGSERARRWDAALGRTWMAEAAAEWILLTYRRNGPEPPPAR